MIDNIFTIYTNPFFDEVITFMDNMPSASDKYKLVDPEANLFRLMAKDNVKEFMTSIRERLNAKKKSQWPYSGDLYMALSISGPKKHIYNKDLDNLLKTLFDSLKGIVFIDDRQIVKLSAEKEVTDRYEGVLVAIRKLDTDERLRITPYIYTSGKDSWASERKEKAQRGLETFFDHY